MEEEKMHGFTNLKRFHGTSSMIIVHDGHNSSALGFSGLRAQGCNPDPSVAPHTASPRKHKLW